MLMRNSCVLRWGFFAPSPEFKIEDVNFSDSDPRKSPRPLFGYAIAAKGYALYTKTGNSIAVVKASGHGLGYLFAPKKKW